MTITESIIYARNKLSNICDRPMYEAQLLLCHHLGVERTYIHMHSRNELKDAAGFMSLVERRAAHEPMEYITNRVSFYDMELYIAPGALIPRPETEILVEKAAEIVHKHDLEYIAEIGIGSGAISIALARQFPDLHIVASDISKDALDVARKNIEAFGLEERIDLHHTSLLDGIESPIEMIVSNPPYIAKGTQLEPNVDEYEPHTALFADEHGDEILRDIITLGADREIAFIACEMGYDQKASISAFVKELGVYSTQFYTDLAGLDRGFTLELEIKN